MISEKDRYQASAHYVWRQDPSDILGEGAFGTVYRGFHKESCDAVAIKTFNKMSLKRPLSVQSRELNILQKLDHPNVVKLIAVEELVTNRRGSSSTANVLDGKVLIMELCTEGSLYSIIEQPENQFGLEEGELLRVLEDTTGGMKYLRKNKIVHRDWKPSNILKTVTNEGSILYKLCDFGAARELDDNQPFFSIVGTEEYIPPDIYGRALLGHSNKNFFATSELWSFGVTLYHVATGSLPFRPFGGRRNRETMYKILSSKETGVISGVQEKENGPVLWSRDLPSYCPLSKQSRKFLNNLLACLLETDQSKLLNFDQFFGHVDEFLSKKKIRVVFSDLRSEYFYFDSDVKFSIFLNGIISQPNGPNENIFGWHDERIFGKTCQLENFQIQSMTRSPIFISVPFSNGTMIDFPCQLKLEESRDLNADYDTANMCSALVFWALQRTKEFSGCKEQLMQIAVAILKDFEKRHSNIGHQLSLAQKMVANFEMYSTSANSFNGLSKSSKLLQSLLTCIESTFRNSVELNKQLEKLKKSLPKFSESNLVTIFDRFVCTVFEICMQFRNDKVMARSNGDLSINEMKWHDLQKRQLTTVWQKVQENWRNSSILADAKSMTLFYEFAAKCNISLKSCEEEILLIEEMLVSANHSLAQLHSETAMPKNPEDNSTIPVASLHSLLKETLDEIRDLRSLAVKNKQILSTMQFDDT